MKDLIGVVAALGVLSAGAALLSAGRSGILVASPPPSFSATAEARCPDFTLEDDGVCLPLGRSKTARVLSDVAGWVHPDALLSAWLSTGKQAPVPSSQRELLGDETPVVVLRTRVQSPVTCDVPWTQAHVSHLETTSEGAVVTLAGTTSDGATAELKLWGLQGMAAGLSAGTPCSSETHLGTSGDVLVFALPPSNAQPAEDVQSPARLLDIFRR